MSDTQQNNKPLRLGFVGGGLSSAVGQVHMCASQMDGHWQLQAGAFSRDQSINQKTAEAWNVARVYDDWRQLLDAERTQLDAVAVLTPTPDHADEVCEILERGIPVICEKALAVSLDEAARIREVLTRTNGFLAVTYNYSGYPLVRELRQRIENGELGKIHQIQFEMPQEGFVRPPSIAGKASPPQAWRLKDTEIPMVAFDLGIHLFHLAHFLTAKNVVRTMADFSNFSPYPNLVDDIRMWLEYDDGMKGDFWMSKTSLGNRNGMRLRLYGDKASVDWVQAQPETLHISYADGRNEIVDRGSQTHVAGLLRYNRMKPGHPAGFIEAFANLYCDLADALQQYRAQGSHTHPYVYGLDHSQDALKLFSAARRAHVQKSWQDV